MASLTESNNSTYDSLQGSYSSQSVRQISRTDPHDDFLAFLSIAQKYNTDFISTTWQPGFGLLGEGGYGRVNQSLVNLQFSFAFKRIPQSSKHNETFKEAITELSILCQPFIRDHPNIIKLEGICWRSTQKLTEFCLFFFLRSQERVTCITSWVLLRAVVYLLR